ncbi:SGNH/GDSL hydrolase family protein, partial [Allosphingosinicella sp.]|uniref:SGNH/GDSL hydrolase family protein n=1 Tax=Allosphingosinicella sp. TaxID=2823234 RepID=UPI002EF2CCE5
ILASASTTTPEAPVALIGPRLRQAAAEGRTINVGVFGDSFGDGVWAGLYHQLPSAEGIVVHKLSRQATGFTRYRTLNLLDDIGARLQRQPIDIAVLSYGANDMQGIYHEGRGAMFMTPEWRRIVAERVGAVVARLREHGAVVYWVGLPKMRDPAYDSQVQAMNGFYTERMRELAVPYIDTARMSVDSSGQYAPYLLNPANGERTMARANDGIHMTIPGYLILTRGLSARIRASVAEARARNGAGRPVREATKGPAGGSRQTI